LELQAPEEFLGDSKEFAEKKWGLATMWYDQYLAGELLIVPPVLKVLEFLKKGMDLSEWPQKMLPEGELPSVCFLHGVEQIFVPSNTILPAKDTNCFFIARDQGSPLVVDPAPKSEADRLLLISKLKRSGAEDFFITHHHTDHWDALGDIFKQFGGKIYLSSASWEIFKQKHADYWGEWCQERITVVKDGEILGKWKGHDIICEAIPGHASGHMALKSSGGHWYIVGDLIQGTDSVVVGGQHGNMDHYIASLERVIAASPQVIFPSHGLPLGGVFFLKKLLHHRLMREQEILDLWKKDKNIQEIMQTLYPNLPSEFHQELAIANIEAHLTRLRNLRAIE
jgi:glyoxylase-like metal-dependent hydrolase (beta-lactamase superfamily II)